MRAGQRSRHVREVEGTSVACEGKGAATEAWLAKCACPASGAATTQHHRLGA